VIALAEVSTAPANVICAALPRRRAAREKLIA